ncbi:MAG: hypothetical protein FVQ78_03975 [Solirubrobacterales bacterium]|nr:hypothetical protein [Solirubrobacterales bacterium]
MSAASRARLLVGGAVVAAAALAAVYLATGGSSYSPAQTRSPCEDRPWRDPEGIQAIAEQFSLSALDGAACELGVTRETLARALPTPRSRDRFTRRYGISDAELAGAIRAGLVRAIDDAERAGALSPVFAEPLRETVQQIPTDEAIELIQGARTLLDNAQTFLGPARGLLERLLR